jgi:hypothetical protein
MVLLSIIFLLLVRGRSNEPTYGGKTLTQWLRIHRPDPGTFWQPNDFYGHIHDELWYRLVEVTKRSNEASTVVEATTVPESSGGGPVIAEDVIAVRQIGTNAIPRLIQLMASKQTPVQKVRLAIAERLQFLPVAGRLLNPYWGRDPAQECHIAACDGFSILGTNGESALPALSNLLFTGEVDFPLAATIAGRGRRGITLLTNALARLPASRHDEIALALGLSGDAAQSAVPALVNCVERGSAGYDVLGALGRLECDDPRLVPALVRLLQARSAQTNLNLREDMAFLVLGLQREKARVAAPLVIAEYRLVAKDPVGAADRRFYRRILRAIAPDMESQLPPPLGADEDAEDWP